MRRRAHWTTALGASLAVHAGAAAFMLALSKDEVEIAGGEAGQTVVLGSAFADMVAAGEPAETVEAVAEEADVIAPAEPETAPAAPVEQAAVDPVEPVTAAPAESRSLAPPAQTPPEAQSAKTGTVEALKPAQAEVAEPREAQTRREEKTVAPVEPQESVVAMAPVPRPTPRPDYQPPKEKKVEAPAQPKAKRQPQRERGEERRRSAGSGGRDAQDARRGTPDGGQRADVEGGRKAARASQAGNAAVSNYPGQIVTRLRRALRYPREAKRERLRGEVRVAFTIGSNGAVGNIRVVRSSGSPILDRAAVETVQRAAPFPAIPAGAGRSSWPFTVPLAFVR